MPEDVPFRLRVLRNLTAILEEVTPANGYKSDLSEAVYRGRTIFGETDKLPMVAILEAPLPLDPMESPGGESTSKGYWPLLLQGFAQDDHSNPTDPAHFLMADVRQRLAKELEKNRRERRYDMLGMGGLVTKMTLGRGVVRPPDELSSRAYFYLELALELVEDPADPYA